jgi:hypothetical protein
MENGKWEMKNDKWKIKGISKMDFLQANELHSVLTAGKQTR